MKHDVFAKWIKGVIIGTTLIGIGCCVYVIPMLSRVMELEYPDYISFITPWMIVLYIAALPCFAAMVLSWIIASNIQKDNSFCMENAKLFKIFSYLAVGDSVFFLSTSIVFWLLGMNHAGLVLVDCLIVFMGLAVFVCTSALSYLVGKASVLQEDSDLTI